MMSDITPTERMILENQEAILYALRQLMFAANMPHHVVSVVQSRMEVTSETLRPRT